MHKVTLGDVAREVKDTYKGAKSGMPVVGLEHLIPQEMKLTAWDDDKDNTFTKMFRKGQVLFGRRRAYLKKAAVAPFDGICSGDITVVEAIPNKIVPELLPFIMQNDIFFDYAVGKSAGSLSPRVKWEHLADYEFVLPSIEEQTKLSKVLWAFQETKEAYKKLLTATDELVKSQFIEMFGDPESKGFTMATIGDCCLLKSGTSLPADVENEGGEILYVKVADMNLNGNEKYIVDSTHYVSRTTAGNGIFPKGTVIFPKRGGAIGTNKKRMTISEICADLNIMGVIPGKKILSAYLLGFFEQIDMGTLNNGTTVPQINNKDIAPLPIAIPPLEFQKQYTGFVEQIDKSKFAIFQMPYR